MSTDHPREQIRCPLNERRVYRFEVTMRPPGGAPVCYAASIDNDAFDGALDPLPADRELHFAIDAQERARAQKANRAALVRHVTEALAHKIAEVLAPKFLEAIESRDTQNGYSPAALRAMNAPFLCQT